MSQSSNVNIVIAQLEFFLTVYLHGLGNPSGRLQQVLFRSLDYLHRELSVYVQRTVHRLDCWHKIAISRIAMLLWQQLLVQCGDLKSMSTTSLLGGKESTARDELKAFVEEFVQKGEQGHKLLAAPIDKHLCNIDSVTWAIGVFSSRSKTTLGTECTPKESGKKKRQRDDKEATAGKKKITPEVKKEISVSVNAVWGAMPPLKSLLHGAHSEQGAFDKQILSGGLYYFIGTFSEEQLQECCVQRLFLPEHVAAIASANELINFIVVSALPTADAVKAAKAVRDLDQFSDLGDHAALPQLPTVETEEVLLVQTRSELQVEDTARGTPRSTLLEKFRVFCPSADPSIAAGMSSDVLAVLFTATASPNEEDQTTLRKYRLPLTRQSTKWQLSQWYWTEELKKFCEDHCTPGTKVPASRPKLITYTLNLLKKIDKG